MRVFLVDAPHKIWPLMRGWTPCPGILPLGAYLEKDFDVRVVDGTVLENSWGDFEEIMRKEKPKLVGISCIATCFIYDTINACRLIKEVSPKTVIVAGGSHPALVPEETLRSCREIDYIVVGEGEITFYEFLKAFEKGEKNFLKIKGLAYLEGDKFVYTGERPLIEDLDTLPMNAYHLFDMSSPRYNIASEGRNSISVTFSRGCEYKCTFCSEVILWRHRWRKKSAKKIVDEFQLLKEKYGKTAFFVGDDMFNWDRKHTEEFCDEMIRRKVKVNFWIQTRADFLLRDKDLIPRLKEAGCYQIMMGLEHHNQKVLNDINKQALINQSFEAMKLIKKHRISGMATLMLGHWGDTKENMYDFYRFARPYLHHYGQGVVTPLPGTPFYKEMKRLGRIKVTDYSKYDYLHATMPTKTMSPDEITKTLLNLHRKFYLNWRFFLQTIFPHHPMIRPIHLHFLRYAWDTFRQEAFGAPEWTQPGYQTYEEYLKVRETSKKSNVQCPMSNVKD